MAEPFSIGSTKWPGISKLIEEAGEVQQVCGKLIGTGGERAHWDGSDLQLRLEDELADLLAAIAFVQDHNGLDKVRIAYRVVERTQRFRNWHSTELAKCADGIR